MKENQPVKQLTIPHVNPYRDFPKVGEWKLPTEFSHNAQTHKELRKIVRPPVAPPAEPAT